MTRPRHILSVFAICFATVLAAMAWVSVVVIQLDHRDAATQRLAEVEESARLALWRMDSALGPILAQEGTRPLSEYQPFFSPPWAFDGEFRPHLTSDVVLPSPLLLRPTPFVRLHFQISPDRRVTSPQVPERNIPELIEQRLVSAAHLETASGDLSRLAAKLDFEMLLAAAPPPDTVSSPADTASMSAISGRWLAKLNARNDLRQSTLPLDLKQVGRARNAPAQQQLRSDMEYQQRMEAYAQNAMINKFNRDANIPPQASLAPSVVAKTKQESDNGFPVEALAREGDTKPLWVEGQLLLVRQVTLGDQTYLQGCWLDWETLREWLLARVLDLLPDAQLLPVDGSLQPSDQGTSHLLAALPVRLVPGSFQGRGESLSIPIRTSLVIAWACALLAIVAVAVLVIGMVALSERRAAFVSAVTHELRTPLTTFRMYTEMLTGGMVEEEERRMEYLATLRREADRLARLVENVLSYARLERNRAALHLEDTTLGQMIDRFSDRLQQRTEQAGMELVITLDDTTRESPIRTDVSAVEQIVFNVVDNACKYAAGAKDRRVHLDVEQRQRRLRVTVSDHGPGVEPDVLRRLFSPFSKSAKAAANSAQGVGLGLALCRRLVRRLGGNLRLVKSDGNGCRFEITLPRSGLPTPD